MERLAGLADELSLRFNLFTGLAEQGGRQNDKARGMLSIQLGSEEIQVIQQKIKKYKAEHNNVVGDEVILKWLHSMNVHLSWIDVSQLQDLDPVKHKSVYDVIFQDDPRFVLLGFLSTTSDEGQHPVVVQRLGEDQLPYGKIKDTADITVLTLQDPETLLHMANLIMEIYSLAPTVAIQQLRMCAWPAKADEVRDAIHHLHKHKKCDACGEDAKKRCQKCACVTYCDRKCQKQDWSTHKKVCEKYQALVPLLHTYSQSVF
jgi:hypothetical protein